jgi:hypothetical protein
MMRYFQPPENVPSESEIMRILPQLVNENIGVQSDSMVLPQKRRQVP